MSQSLNVRPPRVWVLNLDAEHELEAQGTYVPTARVRKIVTQQSKALLGSLVQRDDIVLQEDQPVDPRARGLEGWAWCMTPRARRLLLCSGAVPIEAPDLDVLRVANRRTLARCVRHEFLQQQPTGSFDKEVAGGLEQALELVARRAELGWLVRRPFGAAGRGRRRLYAGRPTSSELAWLKASLRLGPLVVEPFVEITREFTRSGFVRADGTVLTSEPGLQTTTAEGAWRGTEFSTARDLLHADDLALEAACHAAGEALREQGYFGPFGIDAFRHRQGSSQGQIEVLNPLSEINARLTMDWAQAMDSDRRP